MLNLLTVIAVIVVIIAVIAAIAIMITMEDMQDLEYQKLFHDKYQSNVVVAQVAEAGVDEEIIKPPASASVELAMIKALYHERLFNRIGDNNFRFYMTVLAATPLPQHIIYLGMHQCYSENAVNWSEKLTNDECGDILVNRLLEGDKGHYSPTEAGTITISLEGFNHGTLQQLLRSRIGVSPSVQSFRYTKKHIIEAGEGKRDIEDVVYLRPIGKYHDREQSYEYTAETRAEDLSFCTYAVKHVCKRLREGMPSEQGRGQLPFDYRQHAVLTMNTRSLMGILDRRSKKDAQAEIQILATLLMEIFHMWQPATAKWYLDNRWGKARLSP
jgi:thymidylate synthase (FAD)